MAGVESIYEVLGFFENFGAFNGGFGDRNFAMRTAGVEGKFYLILLVVPIEGVFHFVAIAVILPVSDNRWDIDIDMMLTK